MLHGKRDFMDIKNKVVIVTGASLGSGYATAKLLAEKGAKTAFVSRSKRKLDQLAQEIPDSLTVRARHALDRKRSNQLNRCNILLNR